jgi:hypothetical protein
LLSDGTLALKTHLFPAVDLAYAGTPPDENGRYQGTLGRMFHNLKSNGGAAFVMHDHIGITQELNDFRNAALQPIQTFMSQKDKAGITNEHKLELIQAIQDVKGAYIKTAMIKESARVQALDRGPQLPNVDVENAKILRARGRIIEAKYLEERARQHEAAKERTRLKILSGAEAEEKWNKKYEPLIAHGAIQTFKDELKKISDLAAKTANQRAEDHAKWIVSERLVDAFDVYDRNDLSHGVFFTKEHLHCTFGMFGIEKNLPTLVKWVSITKVERKNLYMRANFFNQQEIEDEASKAFEAAKQEVVAAGGLAHVSNPPYMKAIKSFVDTLKKADSAWDEWLRDKVVLDIHLEVKPDNVTKETKLAKTKPKIYSKFRDLSKFHRNAEGLLYAQFNEFTQALSSKAGKMDKGIQAIVGTLLYGRLGKLAHEIGIEALMLKVSPEKLSEGYKKRTAARNEELAKRRVNQDMSKRLEKMDDPIDTLIKDEQEKVRRRVKLTLEQIDKGERPETNNFRQARMGVLLMAIEGLSLTLKLNTTDELSARGKAEVTASVMSLASMGIDIVYACAKSLREIKPYKDMLGVDAAADVIRGGLKVMAGALSAGAGAIGAVLDFASLREEYKKEDTDWFLASIYTLRGVNGGISVGLGMIAAASYTAPVLTRLAKSGWSKYLGGAARLGRAATYIKEGIALTRTFWLIRVARFNLIGLVITVGEIGYRLWVMDDELEKWLKRCTFRKEVKNTPYSNKEQEFEALEKAFLATQEE